MDKLYSLSRSTITDTIEANRLGVFTLHDRSKKVKFVGRSDTDLRAALLGHADDYYTLFSFRYAHNRKLAYDYACKLYHQHYDNKLDSHHPVSSPGFTWRCPVCGLHW